MEQGNAVLPIAYMLTRVWRAKDWETGIELSSHILGHLSRLELHHIFSKTRLRKHGYSRPEINALANFTFLTQETNLQVSDRDPAEYVEKFAADNPGVVESHWIPMDQKLWKVENYLDFLSARRELLARAANEFLDNLYAGHIPEKEVRESIADREAAPIPGGVEDEQEERLIRECNEWVSQQGLPAGEYMYELTLVQISFRVSG